MSVNRLSNSCKEFNHVGASNDVNRAGLRYRFSGVQRFEFGQLTVALAQNTRGATQNLAALSRRRL